MKIVDVLIHDIISFELQEPSLVTVYLELPKDMEVQIELSKTKGTFKMIAAAKDLNLNQESILKLRGFKH